MSIQVEVYIRSGTYARKPSLPYTPGTDVAGIVEAVGADVTGVKKGDRVYAHGTAAGYGGYAELTVCNEPQVHPLPDRLSCAQGGAMGVPYGTAWRALLIRAWGASRRDGPHPWRERRRRHCATQIARAHGCA